MGETLFVPAWKKSDGTRIIFPNSAFKKRDDAHRYQLANFLGYVPFGLCMDGILEVEVGDDGQGEIDNVPASMPLLGECAVIAGPGFDARSP